MTENVKKIGRVESILSRLGFIKRVNLETVGIEAPKTNTDSLRGGICYRECRPSDMEIGGMTEMQKLQIQWDAWHRK